MSARDGRIVCIMSVDAMSDLGNAAPSTYAVEYDSSFELQAAGMIPAGFMTNTPYSSLQLAATKSGAMLVWQGGFYEFDDKMQSVAQLSIDFEYGSRAGPSAERRWHVRA